MKHSCYAFSMVALTCALLATVARGDVPNAMGHQGLLVLPDGSLAPDGDYDLSFGIWDAAGNEGTRLFEDTVAANVAHGMYNVVLTGGSTPLADLFESGPLFLEVEIVTSPGDALNGMVLEPRQHVDSVPYAFSAARTQQVAGEPPATVPTGTILLWDQATGCDDKPRSCPCGYDEAGEFRGRTVRGADKTGVSADIPDDAGASLGKPDEPGRYGDILTEAETASHAHTVQNGGSHRHNFVDPAASFGVIDLSQGTITGCFGCLAISGHNISAFSASSTLPAGAHRHQVGSSGGEPHYHPFRTVLFCRRR